MPFVSLFHGKVLLSYTDEFKERVSFPITTPDGFTVYCEDVDETARHICCGKKKTNPVNLGRAQRILWLDEILNDTSLRRVIVQNPTKNVIFFCESKKYIVICSEPQQGSKSLKIISAYPVSGNLFVALREMKRPYEVYPGL